MVATKRGSWMEMSMDSASASTGSMMYPLVRESQMALKWLMYQMLPLNSLQTPISRSLSMTLPVSRKPCMMCSTISLVSISPSFILSAWRKKNRFVPKISYIALTCDPMNMYAADAFSSGDRPAKTSSIFLQTRYPSSVSMMFWNSSIVTNIRCPFFWAAR